MAIAVHEEPASGRPSGQGQDFDAVYREYFAFVWRCLRGLGLREPGLDDAAQDVFVAVHRRLAGFRGESSLRTWLYGIVRNVAANHRRTSARKAGTEPLAEQLPYVGPDPIERAQEAEAAAFLQKFLDGLEAKRREVFLLVMLEEMSVPEVAAALSIPLNTAYTRLRLGREDFARAVARETEP